MYGRKNRTLADCAVKGEKAAGLLKPIKETDVFCFERRSKTRPLGWKEDAQSPHFLRRLYHNSTGCAITGVFSVCFVKTGVTNQPRCAIIIKYYGYTGEKAACEGFTPWNLIKMQE